MIIASYILLIVACLCCLMKYVVRGILTWHLIQYKEDIIHWPRVYSCTKSIISFVSDGILLKEVHRLLRPNGYFVYSAPPAYRKDKNFPEIWDKLVNITTSMCWELIAKQVQTAIWVKPDNNLCRQKNADRNTVSICNSAIDDSAPSWKVPLQNCVRLSGDESNYQKLPPRPDRLNFYSRSLEKLG